LAIPSGIPSARNIFKMINSSRIIQKLSKSHLFALYY